MNGRQYPAMKKNRIIALLAAVAAVTAVSTTSEAVATSASSAILATSATPANVGGASTTTATLVAKVADAQPGPFGTSLEGAAFDSNGTFYFVDTTAAPDQPRLMSMDLTTHKVTALYQDAKDTTSMLNCVGFAPGGDMYLCDLRGRIVKYDPATRRLSTVLDRVGGQAIVPDDLTIAPNGDMYIADYKGTPTAPTGRILLRPVSGAPSVAVSGLVHPNGIVLTGKQDGVWVDEDLAGRLDHVGPGYSSPASTAVEITVHTVAYLSLGSSAYADSLTIDGAGNIYLAVYGGSEVLEFNPDGVQTGRVVVPGDAPNVTHVAIRPGTRDAYVTASGKGGGYIYKFKALAPALPHMPNGG
jgi:lactonase